MVNPNRTLPNSSVTKKKKKTIGQLLVPISPSNFPALSKSTVVVGSEIYVIGGPVNKAPSSAIRILDCRSHTWRDAPSMNVARDYALTCAYDGKIYVMGGCGGLEYESWAEVFDTKTQTWDCLPDPAHNMYAYDTKQGKWECCENKSASFPRSECVIENVWFRYGSYGQCMCQWYDIKDGNWKEVKGLGSLRIKYRRNGGSCSSIRKLVSCGGKLLLIWEGYMKRNPNDMKKVWCAEIVLEKLDGGEVWGNVEWVDVVHTVPISRYLLHCLAVSV